MRILLGSQEAAKDREAFFTAQVLFWLLAAPDGHAKNYSVFIEGGGRFRLTPLYDIMSAYPVLGHGSGLIPPEKLRLAMAFTGKTGITSGAGSARAISGRQRTTVVSWPS